MARLATMSNDRAALIAAAFRQAIAEGRAHEGATAPNPAVGCVLMDAQGKVLAAAGHARAGAPHAEAAALALAHQRGLAAEIHTAVVTLEPCNHRGRTGPCSEALLANSVRELWYALPDPNSQASGGAARLRDTGVVVHTLAELDHPDRDALSRDATRLLAPFSTRVGLHRPFVTVKQALDPAGSMIPPAGRKTFTGPAALTLAHQLRRRADAILTGSGTILADHPEFTVRHVPDILGKSRALVILDRRRRVDATYLDEARARDFRPRIADDLATSLAELATEGCNEVLVEAGPSLLASLREAGLWDEWVTIRQGAAPDGDDAITITHQTREEEPA